MKKQNDIVISVLCMGFVKMDGIPLFFDFQSDVSGQTRYVPPPNTLVFDIYSRFRAKTGVFTSSRYAHSESFENPTFPCEKDRKIALFVPAQF